MFRLGHLGGVEVELVVPERVVEGESVLGAGESLDGDQGVPVVGADVCGAAGHVCDLLQRLFLFFCGDMGTCVLGILIPDEM